MAGQPTRGSIYRGSEVHSPFALALFDALNGDADLVPKGQGDGVITLRALPVSARWWRWRPRPIPLRALRADAGPVAIEKSIAKVNLSSWSPAIRSTCRQPLP